MPLKSIIETILFVHAESIGLEKLSEISKHSPEEVMAAIAELEQEYADRGLAIIRNQDTFQVASNPANAQYLEELVKSDFPEELSRSALETLAVVAYRGPLTRVEIDFLRGVNSSFTLRNLLMRGLVERTDNPKDSRSFIYRVTTDFLKHLGVTKIEDLPRFEEYKNRAIEIPGDQKSE